MNYLRKIILYNIIAQKSRGTIKCRHFWTLSDVETVFCGILCKSNTSDTCTLIVYTSTNYYYTCTNSDYECYVCSTLKVHSPNQLDETQNKFSSCEVKCSLLNLYLLAVQCIQAPLHRMLCFVVFFRRCWFGPVKCVWCTDRDALENQICTDMGLVCDIVLDNHPKKVWEYFWMIFQCFCGCLKNWKELQKIKTGSYLSK